jgi:hypothetical protein
MVDPARLIINCVERGKVSAEVIVLRLVGHAITYGNVAYDPNIIGRALGSSLTRIGNVSWV